MEYNENIFKPAVHEGLASDLEICEIFKVDIMIV